MLSFSPSPLPFHPHLSPGRKGRASRGQVWLCWVRALIEMVEGILPFVGACWSRMLVVGARRAPGGSKLCAWVGGDGMAAEMCPCSLGLAGPAGVLRATRSWAQGRGILLSKQGGPGSLSHTLLSPGGWCEEVKLP